MAESRGRDRDKLALEVDVHLEKLLDYMQNNIPAHKLIGIAEGLPQTARLLWGGYSQEPVRLFVLTAKPLSTLDGRQPDATVWPQTWAVLVMVLWRQDVVLCDSYFVTTSMAAIYSRPSCDRAWLGQLVKGWIVACFNKVTILVQRHCLLFLEHGGSGFELKWRRAGGSDPIPEGTAVYKAAPDTNQTPSVMDGSPRLDSLSHHGTANRAFVFSPIGTASP